MMNSDDKRELIPLGVCCTEGFTSSQKKSVGPGSSSENEDSEKCSMEPSEIPQLSNVFPEPLSPLKL